MELKLSLNHESFKRLNQYVLETKEWIQASAASVLIIKDGEIVNEQYYGSHDHTEHSRKVDRHSQFNIASIRKTYLGFAISLALYERKIKSLDDCITNYISNQDGNVLKGTTIRHLLTHTHGLYNLEKRLFEAGTDWKYNNAGVNLLIKLVQTVFQKSLAEVIRDNILIPCQLTETGWRKLKKECLVWVDESYNDEQGNEANLFVSTRELGYWGYLHLTQGDVQGNQIVPQAVFEQVANIISPELIDKQLPKHGFFWWVQDEPSLSSELGIQLPKGSFQSLGIFGCAVLVIPRHNVVAVRMYNQIESNPQGYHYLHDIQSFGNLVLQECF
ncbi:serine hydrolase domain-containing protein [Paenibacillus aquistagni]|uniref:CubicO group peptidase, beta-lactamase class C family n=1 Tax=Paenibacillus aquistagni TaxID=1852522 RepID=A0A1X7IYI0_9BACL|nr:serine hydrolase domain-containing protein [Paenibacillus aquistagni]SMG20062.1 CubicO group peptidase, beta-lactamase class C family [Paenibacillus aquistagni]